MGKTFLFVLVLLSTSFAGCLGEDDDNRDYRDMKGCFQVTGHGTNAHEYDYSYDLKTASGSTGSEEDEGAYYSCTEEFASLDYLNVEMKDTSCGSGCEAHAYVQWFIDEDGDGEKEWVQCDEDEEEGRSASASCTSP